MIHLVFVGRLTADKRLDLFLDTMRELRRRGEQVQATVIGAGTLRTYAEQLVEAEGLPVEFVGWRRRWWEYAEAFDCLLMTSNSEGFGNVLVEAASAGLPVVASSRALSVADAIVPGLTGELTVADTVGAFADAVLRISRRGAPNVEAVSRWLARFSVEASTQQLLDALTAICSQSDTRP